MTEQGRSNRRVPTRAREEGSGAGETAAHQLLKAAAFRWAREQAGMRAAGMEVRLPDSAYRADVAACRLEGSSAEGRGDLEISCSAIFECKQSLADLRKDAGEWRESLRRLDDLRRRRERLERLLGTHYPTLRMGDSLFPEYQSVDLEGMPGLRHEGYRKVCREIRILDQRVHGGSKFERMRHWKLADRLYLVVPEALAERARVAEGWGLLVAPSVAASLKRSGKEDPRGEGEEGEWAGDVPALELVRAPAHLDCGAARRLALLHRLAAAAAERQARELR